MFGLTRVKILPLKYKPQARTNIEIGKVYHINMKGVHLSGDRPGRKFYYIHELDDLIYDDEFKVVERNLPHWF